MVRKKIRTDCIGVSVSRRTKMAFKKMKKKIAYEFLFMQFTQNHKIHE